MTPPRLARLWVRLIAPTELRDPILDDLDEVASAARSPFLAYRRYWREVLRGTPHLIRLRLESGRARRVSAPHRYIASGVLFDRLRRDTRHAVRSVWREPTFALTATLTLALGVGVTTTAFSIVDAEFWKRVPFPNAHELVKVYTRVGDRGAVAPISGAEFLDWRRGSPAFAALAADGLVSRQTLQLERAQSVLVSFVTANYFDVLGRPVLAGRTFTDADALGAGAAVLTARAWQRLFEASPEVVGRTIALNGEAVVIVGIVEDNDALGRDTDVFRALDERTPSFLDRRQPLFFGAVGRMRTGTDGALAAKQLEIVSARIAAEHPGTQAGRTIYVDDLSEFYTSSNWRPLFFLLGAALVVLLVSAVNVAALVLGRALGRTREFALRGALGGGPGAVGRQLVVEGALIAFPAGALGVLFAHWGVGVTASRLDGLFRGEAIPIDERVAAFALALSVLTTLLFALAPFAATRRLDLSVMLARGGRSGRTAGEGRARAVLLTAQLALTMVLLTGAAILLKSFVALTNVPLGFDPANLLAMRAPLGGPRYSSDASVRDYAERVIAAGLAVPGVQEAAVASSSPLGSGPLVNVAWTDQPRPAPGTEPRAITRAVSVGYFRTVRIPLVRGREFSSADVAGAPRVAIVNEVLARQVAPDGNPVGQTIELLPGARASWLRRPGILTIVGVSANAKEVTPNEVAFPSLYVPLAQLPPTTIEVVVRTATLSSGGVVALRSAVAAVDPAVPVGAVTTFGERLDGALSPDRFNLQMVSAFATLGLVLAAVGIYGTVAYAVQMRTRELGVRLALGARPARLISSAVWQACRIGLAGGILGVMAIVVLSRVMGDALYLVPGSHNGLLYGVTVTDPLMLAVAFAGIIAVAVVAAMLPARRIARLDPVRALRAE